MPTSSIVTDDTISTVSHATTALTFASLPQQIQRKSAKKGFTFNMMVVGTPGSGKTCLASSLFDFDLELYPQSMRPKMKLEEMVRKQIEIKQKIFEIERDGLKLNLNFIEALYYGFATHLDNTYQPIVKFLEDRLHDYYKQENGINRRSIVDHRVHCLLFVISPMRQSSLSEFDIEFLKAVHDKVNIIMIINKADALSQRERRAFKDRVREKLAKHNIKVYQVPDPEIDGVEAEHRDVVHAMRDAAPLTVLTGVWRDAKGDLQDQKDRGQRDNLEHSDFPLLRALMVMYLSDLCDTTRDVHYENYRCKLLSERKQI